MVMVGPQSGGADYLWVKGPNGNVIMNESLTADTQPPSPSGYFGFFAISFPMSVNGTYVFGIKNSWGVSSVFQTYDNVVHLPPPPNEEYFLMTFLGFLLVGLYFVGKIARRRYIQVDFQGSFNFMSMVPDVYQLGPTTIRLGRASSMACTKCRSSCCTCNRGTGMFRRPGWRWN